MRVTMLALGSRGDVHPMVALGMGLRQAGHDVTVATSPDFTGFVRGRGLRAHPVGNSTYDTTNLRALQRWASGGSRNISHEMLLVARAIREVAADYALDLADLPGATDVYVSGLLSLESADVLSDLDGAGHVNVQFMPVHPTKSGHASTFAVRPDRSTTVNALAGGRVLSSMSFMFGATAKRLRADLGVPRATRGRMAMIQTRTPTLLAVSRHVIPRPDDWPAHVQVTGPLFLPQVSTPPDLELLEWIEAGPKPVYVGFGSMGSTDAQAMTDMIVSSLTAAGRRGVLSRGWAHLGEGEAPEGIRIIDDCPHSWLFPRMGAVVHHGGSGTSSAVFRAGVPGGVIPHLGDQFYFGRRHRQLGIGPKPVPRKKLTEKSLTQLIASFEQHPEFAVNAEVLGQKVRQEDGVRDGVDFVEEYSLKRRHKVGRRRFRRSRA